MENKLDDRVEIDRVELNRIAFCESRKLCLPPDIKFGVDWAEHEVNVLCLSLHSYIYSEDSPIRRQVIKFPKTWWQHFKQDVMPRWFTRRWPVEYKVEVVDVQAIYPDFKQKLPEEVGGKAVLMVARPKLSEMELDSLSQGK